MATEIKTIRVTTGDGSDELVLVVGADRNAVLTGVGCPELLAVLRTWRSRLIGDPQSWTIPEGDGHAQMLARELVLKARGEWKMPLEGAELCHCRAVETRAVDVAVVRGARTPSEVGARTGAGTQCGTCRPDIQDVISCRVTGS